MPEHAVYEAYYRDEKGNEHELGAVTAESEEEARHLLPRQIEQMFGHEERLKWEHFGPRVRRAET